LAVTDISDLKFRRRRKKLIDVLFKVFILAVIVLLGLSLILTKDTWYPRLSGILAGTPFGNNEVVAASAGFPVSIPENSSSSVKPTADGFAVLTDTRLTAYKDNADILFDVSHDLVSPVFDTDAGNILLYDLGGKRFRFYDGRKLVFEKSTDFPIQIGRVSGGFIAVSAEHDRYLSDLTVYDKTGTMIWNYKSINRITDVTFTENSDGIYITVSDSKAGDLVSKILCYSFGEPVKDEDGNAVPMYESEFIKTFTLKTELFGSDGIILIGDRQAALYDRECNLLDSVVYNNDIIDFDTAGDTEGNKSAFILEKGGYVISADTVTKKFKSFFVRPEAHKLSAKPGSFAVLTDLDVTVYRALGEEVIKTGTDGSYRDIITKEGFSFLVGFDGIIRIEV
jgi:hypothetical protein